MEKAHHPIGTPSGGAARVFDLDVLLTVQDDLVLRVLQTEDASALFQLVDRNREHLRRFLGWVDGNRSEEDTLAFIKKQRERLARQEWLTMAIWYKQALVGLIGFQEIDLLNRSASIGYWLDEAHQGRGIMTRSVKALLDYGFGELGIHRVEILCAVENKKSQQIPISLGFVKEGLLKDAIWHYGDYFDAYLWGLTAPPSSSG